MSIIKGWRINPFWLKGFAYPKWHTQKKYIHMKEEEESIYKIRRNNSEQLYKEKFDEEEII